MDIKEFRSDADRTKKKTTEYPEDVKYGTVNYKVYMAIAVVAIAIAAIIIVFINVNKFDIKKYIKPVYTGANGYASVTFVIDEDGLYERLSGKNPDSDKQYYVNKFIESLSAHTNATDIKNGDVIDVVIDYNSSYANVVKADIPHSEYSYKARGITDGAVIDLYARVDVAFTGISPDARIIVSNDWEDDYLKTLTFSASKQDGIRLGDTIEITCDTSYEDLARQGIIAKTMAMKCTADMLNSYCDSAGQIDTKLMDTIYSEIKDTIKNETEDATYRMLFAATGNTDYLYHLNEENADNITIEAVYFLNRIDDGNEKDDEDKTNIIRNYIYVLASADISDNEGSEKVGFMFEYNNAYITTDGTFNIVHDNQNKRFACSVDEENLYDKYVGDLKNNYTIDKIR